LDGMTQPHPNVTVADVERVVRRDYAADRVDEVHKMLSEYGAEDWHPEVDRVRMAILKLAAGNFEELRMHLEIAKRDFRDVLSEAEYPLYTKKWFRIDTLPADEQQRIIDADWKQYEDWLKRK
jgi:predicted metal-dependent hydrolase